jgi:hypothetical protein
MAKAKQNARRSDSVSYTIKLLLFASETKPQVFRIITRNCMDRQDYPMVASWNYIVSKRLRLTAGPVGAGLDELERLVADYLRDDSQETNEHFIGELARAEVIEVSIPYESEEVGWAARLFPWENALSIITRRHRQRSLVVVRHLDVLKQNIVARRGIGLVSAMVVRSTPGDFAQNYDFRSESALVKFRLGCDDNAFTDLETPTRDTMAATIKAKKPDVIHLAVLDTHGVSISQPDLLRGAWTNAANEKERREGIILRGDSTPYRAVDPEETGNLVTDGGKHCPLLVSYATCYSATRLAPMAVAFGAQAAIGFHEDLSNGTSEAFFDAFYESWRCEEWDLLKAFQKALKVMWGQPESGRSGVSLWSAASLVAGRAQLTAKTRIDIRPTKTPGGAFPLDDASVRTLFTVACEPLRKVNYCSLHNGRDLFVGFSIKKNAPGWVPSVEVRVELTAENETAVWRQSLVFGDAPGTEILGSRVRVPLGARALRRVQESTRSSLFVEVRCGPYMLFQQSSQITLLPVDEWRDTDDDRRWLPSFVLPRDPAIRQIMIAADRYLRALCDDSGAGFDGYQQANEWPEIVDLQARAIWCALLYDFRLRYINPPPTYTKIETGVAQRLRTPSQIIEEGRGTCIDLALLFTSCLEYVGIYPVIFLISGHAFPGWWRNENSYRAFAGFSYIDGAGGREVEKMAKGPLARDEYAQWMVTGNTGFRELVTPLLEGNLAALESTLLCSSGAFEEALQQGRENLADAAIFDALINIQRAREGDNPVTPLPIVGGPVTAPGAPAAISPELGS